MCVCVCACVRACVDLLDGHRCVKKGGRPLYNPLAFDGIFQC